MRLWVDFGFTIYIYRFAFTIPSDSCPIRLIYWDDFIGMMGSGMMYHDSMSKVPIAYV